MPAPLFVLLAGKRKRAPDLPWCRRAWGTAHRGGASPVMRRALSVAEKPSVAKELAHILSNGQAQRREGASPYNKIFEFQ